MVTVSELVFGSLAVAALVVALYFGLKQLEERRESQKFRRLMSSYLKANTRPGQEVSLGPGPTGKVVEQRNGEYTLVAEPGAYHVEVSPADMTRSDEREEE